MKPAKGYLAVDGTFFDDLIDCELYEADMQLGSSLTEQGIDAERFMGIAFKLFGQIQRWYHAKQSTENRDRNRETQGAEQGDENQSEDNIVSSFDSGSEEDVTSVFEQQVGLSEPVREVGGGISAEAISYISEELGLRVRRSDASSLRSSPVVATVEIPKPPGTYAGKRSEDV